MRRLPKEKRVRILAPLCEGVSMRATSRLVGVSINTVTKLLVDAGRAAAEIQDKQLRNLKLRRIEADEIWSFCYAKAKNVPIEKLGREGYGDVRTWVALCPDTKLVPSWWVGGRDAATASNFMHDLASRLANRVQLTTDDFVAYLPAVEDAFGLAIDYSMLVKSYSEDKSGGRYSPAQVVGTKKTRITGRPDEKYVSTSLVERQNLNMRMNMRRFTRLTNGHSKKLENLAYALALHYFNYNFCRRHQGIGGKTPAMAAGLTPQPATLGDLVDMMD